MLRIILFRLNKRIFYLKNTDIQIQVAILRDATQNKTKKKNIHEKKNYDIFVKIYCMNFVNYIVKNIYVLTNFL